MNLPEGSRYWLSGRNDAGRTRPERHTALRASFERHGIAVRFDTVPGVGHDGFGVLDPVKTFLSDALS